MFKLPTPHYALRFFSSSHGDHRALHSFPTRRSSDLAVEARLLGVDEAIERGELIARDPLAGVEHRVERFARRSEEHTSELQSRLHLVCRLLLEKKNNSRRNVPHSDNLITINTPESSR